MEHFFVGCGAFLLVCLFVCFNYSEREAKDFFFHKPICEDHLHPFDSQDSCCSSSLGQLFYL